MIPFLHYRNPCRLRSCSVVHDDGQVQFYTPCSCIVNLNRCGLLPPSPGLLNSYASFRAFMHSSFFMLSSIASAIISPPKHYRRNIQFSVFARSLRYVRKPFLVRCICAKVSFQKIFRPQCLFIRFGKSVRASSALMQADISKTLPDFRDVLRVWSVSLCVKMTYTSNIATNIKEHGTL